MEEEHTTAATLGTNYLDLRLELVGCQELGVENNQDAFVQVLNYKNNIMFIIIMLASLNRSM